VRRATINLENGHANIEGFTLDNGPDVNCPIELYEDEELTTLHAIIPWNRVTAVVFERATKNIADLWDPYRAQLRSSHTAAVNALIRAGLSPADVGMLGDTELRGKTRSLGERGLAAIRAVLNGEHPPRPEPIPAPRIHAASSRDIGYSRCGLAGGSGKTTESVEDVTCKACLRIAQ
jgi:hypothetical protein